MSAATANKEGKKGQYKDYVNFLDNYKQERPHGVSEDPTEMSGKSFKDYMESYSTKLYQPVQPTFKKDTTTVKKEGEKLVKSEVFLQIDNETNTTRRITKTFHLNADHQKNSSEPSKTLRHTNSFKHNSVHQEENNIYENTKKSLRKTSSIKEKRRVFEENQEKVVKPKRTELSPNKNNVTTNIIKQQEENKTWLQSKPPSRSSEKKDYVGESAQPKAVESSPTVAIKHNAVTKTSQIATASCFVPPPPPAPPQPLTSAIAKVSTKPSEKANLHSVKKLAQSKAISIPERNRIDEIIQPEAIETKAVIKPSQTTPNTSTIPPPPPLPPATTKLSTNTKPVAFSKTVASSKPVGTQPAILTGRNTLPKIQSDSTDTAPKLDKNDPRVKKLVYGALREMYGTYHDKANDYLATLPKSRVKKNNGLDSIINSIASQGGLDKLSGRMNPKLEVE
ncbi:unnamed protein product [Phaedon cochleariae]|uniref:Uncharacterized protein n=1 Tax=Phaedon cochleariae TaxID=80249 RepID=A0A9N9SFN9_PHACE|nr:unnamed protein product [Phaedon cochleariae]